MERLVTKYTGLFFFFTIIFVTISSCNSKRLENTKELSKEIKASQIIRVTNTQLIYTIDEWGKKISKISEKSVEKELATNPQFAAAICKNISKIPLIEALEKEYNIRIELLGTNNWKDKNLFPKEKGILTAYLYSAKAKTISSDNVQQLNDTLFVYNAPVSADNPICKECMKDQETPFALWRILFDKKEIIRKLDTKMLKE